jgi:peptidoglycan/LPS O-acetylase OafA/YrhL
MSEPTRYHALDAVRAFALLSGIGLHATLSFWPGFREANWPVSDDSPSLALSGLFFVIHIFRMSLFYAIAGFFAHVLLERLGAWNLVKNRLRRIALPLVVSMVAVGPLLLLPYLWAQKQLAMTGMPRIPPPIPDPQLPPWGHLWFLYLLLVLYALWLVARALVSSVDRRGASAALVDRALGALIEHRLAAPVLAAPTAVILYYTPWWVMWQGIPQPVMGLVPNLPSVLAFGSAFAFGWFLHRRMAWIELLERQWLLHALAAVALSAASLHLIGAYPQFHVQELPPLRRAAYAAMYTVSAWCWILFALGAATRFLAHPSARVRYLADASFFMYIMHLPVVYALQAWMIRWPLHWSVKFALIVAIAFAILLAMYHYLVRSTFVGQFLSGRKYPRSATLTSAPSTSPG